jgi:hypothetical protein
MQAHPGIGVPDCFPFGLQPAAQVMDGKGSGVQDQAGLFPDPGETLLFPDQGLLQAEFSGFKGMGTPGLGVAVDQFLKIGFQKNNAEINVQNLKPVADFIPFLVKILLPQIQAHSQTVVLPGSGIHQFADHIRH